MTPDPILIAFAIFAALQVADAYLTLRILRQGGSEQWPPMRLLIRAAERLLGLVDAQRHGATLALVGLKAAYCAALWVYLEQLPVWLLASLLPLYGLVCVSNWQESRGHYSLLDRLRDAWAGLRRGQ
jgi:hypothetical protein